MPLDKALALQARLLREVDESRARWYRAIDAAKGQRQAKSDVAHELIAAKADYMGCLISLAECVRAVLQDRSRQ